LHKAAPLLAPVRCLLDEGSQKVVESLGLLSVEKTSAALVERPVHLTGCMNFEMQPKLALLTFLTLQTRSLELQG
jgi:hypothetical protein